MLTVSSIWVAARGGGDQYAMKRQGILAAAGIKPRCDKTSPSLSQTF